MARCPARKRFRGTANGSRTQRDKYDPRIITRIRPGEAITAADYIELLQQRERFVGEINAAAGGYDAMLMPTTAETAPTIAEVVKDDESYFRFNGRMLRNASIVNLFDGCALSVPCHESGSAPVGLMIAGTQNTDRRILAIGLAVEEAVSKNVPARERLVSECVEPRKGGAT